jgi:hypothetical protein
VGRLRESGNAQRDDDSVSAGGAAVADLLEEMPAWSEVATGDRPGLRQVEEAVHRVHRFGTEAVKDGLRRFVTVRARSPGGLDVADMSKLYVLIRYMYDAPQRAPKDKPRYGSFLGVPDTPDTVDELWPWDLGPDGQPHLTGFFQGYVGESYLALEEADAFEKSYGARA